MALLCPGCKSKKIHPEVGRRGCPFNAFSDILARKMAKTAEELMVAGKTKTQAINEAIQKHQHEDRGLQDGSQQGWMMLWQKSRAQYGSSHQSTNEEERNAMLSIKALMIYFLFLKINRNLVMHQSSIYLVSS